MIRRYLDNDNGKNKNNDFSTGNKREHIKSKNMFKNKNDENKSNRIEINKILKKNQVVILAIALMLMTAGYMNYSNNHENENMLLAELGDAKLVSANVQESNNVLTNETIINNDVNQNEMSKETLNESINNIENSVNNEIVNEENVTNNAFENVLTNDVSVESVNNNITEEVSEENVAQNTVEVASNATDSKKSADYFTKSKLERETMYSQMLETYQNILENEKIPSDQKGIAQSEIKKINDTKNAIMIVENLLETKGFKNVVVFINDPSINVVMQQNDLTTEQVAQVQNIVQRELKADIQNIHISSNKN